MKRLHGDDIVIKTINNEAMSKVTTLTDPVFSISEEFKNLYY